MTHHRVRIRSTIAALVTLAFVAAWPLSAAADVRAEIEAANRNWEAAAAKGDGAATAALYTAEAELLPAQSDFVRGTAAIAGYWQAAFDSGVKGVTLKTLEVESFGNTANEVGTIEIRGANDQVLDRAKYIVIWKKEGDVWKLHRDIWTTSVAPPQP